MLKIVSGDQGPRVAFFWPPINGKTRDSSTSPPADHPSSNDTHSNTHNASISSDIRRVSRSDTISKPSHSPAIPPSPSSVIPPDDLTKSKSIGSMASMSPHPRSSQVASEWTMDSVQRDCRIYGISLSHLGHVLFPPHRYHHKVFELKIDSILYISYPFCWPRIQRRSKQLDGFNIVFAIDLKRNFGKLTPQNKRMWHDIVIKYVRIVQHEERRIGYLSNQLLRMTEITHSVIAAANKRSKETPSNNSMTNLLRDEHNRKDGILSTPPSATTRTESGKPDGVDEVNNVLIEDVIRSALTEICSHCRIADDMKQIQEVLSRNEKIKILINDWVELHCSLKPPEQNMLIRPYHTLLLLPQTECSSDGGGGGGVEEEEKEDQKMEELVDDHHLLSCKSFIHHHRHKLRCIRKDAHDVLQQIPVSGSQSLRLMISSANICSSFGDMASLTNIPLPTLFHFALHLKYWGKAQIIETINKSARFMIHCNANLLMVSRQSEYHRHFQSAFPHRKSLVEELQRFNGDSLMDMMSEDRVEMDDQCREQGIDQREDFIFLIAWLLQRKLIIRVQKYIKWMPPPAAVANSVAVLRAEEEEKEERKRKLQGLFDKIKPYLNGQNHFMEIMFQTGLSSKKLQQVIDTFDEELVFYSH